MGPAEGKKLARSDAKNWLSYSARPATSERGAADHKGHGLCRQHPLSGRGLCGGGCVVIADLPR